MMQKGLNQQAYLRHLIQRFADHVSNRIHELLPRPAADAVSMKASTVD